VVYDISSAALAACGHHPGRHRRCSPVDVRPWPGYIHRQWRLHAFPGDADGGWRLCVLRRLHTIRRSVTDPVFQSLVVSLVLNRLDFGNATLASLPAYQLYRRLQSVLNAAAWLIYQRQRFDHVTPLLRDLHWLKVPERVAYKLAVTVYRCLHGMAPLYLHLKYF